MAFLRVILLIWAYMFSLSLLSRIFCSNDFLNWLFIVWITPWFISSVSEVTFRGEISQSLVSLFKQLRLGNNFCFKKICNFQNTLFEKPLLIRFNFHPSSLKYKVGLFCLSLKMKYVIFAKVSTCVYGYSFFVFFAPEFFIYAIILIT